MHQCQTCYTHCFLCGFQKLLLRHLCKFLHFILLIDILKRKSMNANSTTKWWLCLILNHMYHIHFNTWGRNWQRLPTCTFNFLVSSWTLRQAKEETSSNFYDNKSFCRDYMFHWKNNCKMVCFLISLMQWKPVDVPFHQDLNCPGKINAVAQSRMWFIHSQ